MNATTLYVTTCRYVIMADPDDESTWQDLYRLLPYLKSALSCCVCGAILVNPFGCFESPCSHHVCKACIGGKMRLKPSCSWCKDYKKYTQNKQLRILVHCYKKLCEYVASTSVMCSSHAVPNTNGCISTIADMITEGMNVCDDYSARNQMTESTFNLFSTLPDPTTTVAKKSYKKSTYSRAPVAPSSHKITQYKSKAHQIEGETNRNSLNSSGSLYSVTLAGTGSKIKIKRNWPSHFEGKVKKTKFKLDNFAHSHGDNLHSDSNDMSSSTEKEDQQEDNAQMSKPKLIRKGCRCGTATPSPGKLTCCGQRCPCYVEAKCCFECRCRGCRNPYKPDGTKVVPDYTELVEQTFSSMAESSDESCDVDVNVDM